MKVLILNSGLGTRMGSLTKNQPKCMTDIGSYETILSRQLKIIKTIGITEIIMTTGFSHNVLEEYIHTLNLDLNYTFVYNPRYAITNYIYSIYLARDYLLDSEVIMMHGDLVFEQQVLLNLLDADLSVMTVSSTRPLPSKDFKAVVEKGLITKVGVEFFEQAYAAQPLYKLQQEDWLVWLNKIISYCENGLVDCYAENAFNEISGQIKLFPFDVKNQLCAEIDNLDDLETVKKALSEAKEEGNEIEN